MTPHSEVDLLRSVAGKISPLSETEISFLDDDALTLRVEYELSRLPKAVLNRLVAGAMSPFLPIVDAVVEGVIEGVVYAILAPKPKPKAKAKAKANEDGPMSLDRKIIVLMLSVANLMVIGGFVRCFRMWLNTGRDHVPPLPPVIPRDHGQMFINKYIQQQPNRSVCYPQYLRPEDVEVQWERTRRDVAVTTIAPQPERNGPIFLSKYSTSANVQMVDAMDKTKFKGLLSTPLNDKVKVNLYNWHRSNGQNKIQSILAKSVAVEEAVDTGVLLSLLSLTMQL
ncbi:uncharacterized protein LOC123906724 [Trifolium pratense]|uniref:uncharacterized protein LOC123906724 n=1 Tax=Trifolium pratense TaxID=57577 RepID=UPI001E694B76|nr:uncharacterized protein LOC123906724 [Trifolium pratense]